MVKIVVCYNVMGIYTRFTYIIAWQLLVSLIFLLIIIVAFSRKRWHDKGEMLRILWIIHEHLRIFMQSDAASAKISKRATCSEAKDFFSPSRFGCTSRIFSKYSPSCIQHAQRGKQCATRPFVASASGRPESSQLSYPLSTGDNSRATGSICNSDIRDIQTRWACSGRNAANCVAGRVRRRKRQTVMTISERFLSRRWKRVS